jgi:uncharacterized membrane protein HdeD (DUF308 family)
MLSFKDATATAILIGVPAFVRPGITLTTLVIFFGTYVLVNGVFPEVFSTGIDGFL